MWIKNNYVMDCDISYHEGSFCMNELFQNLFFLMIWLIICFYDFLGNESFNPKRSFYAGKTRTCHESKVWSYLRSRISKNGRWISFEPRGKQKFYKLFGSSWGKDKSQGKRPIVDKSSLKKHNSKYYYKTF